MATLVIAFSSGGEDILNTCIFHIVGALELVQRQHFRRFVHRGRHFQDFHTLLTNRNS